MFFGSVLILFGLHVFEQEKHLSSHMPWKLALEICNQKSPSKIYVMSVLISLSSPLPPPPPLQ